LNIEARIARNVNIFYLTGTIVDIAYRRGYALHLAASVEYNAHRFVVKSPSQRRYVQLKIEACIRSTVIILNMTGTSIDIEQSGGFRLHLAANVEYIAI
jgi:hypothetical protein